MRWLVVASLALLACGVDSEPDPPLTESCVAPQRIVGDRCLAPGVQDNGCPAGTQGLDDGSCRPAGVPAELCAQGFAHDGEAGCEPTLPAEPCAFGQMAIPGERACHSVMACGAGTWGDIPVDGSSIYVDDSYTGGDGDGTETRPFTTIGEGLAVVPSGSLVAVAAGTYEENVVVSKRVRLFGVCPERVAIAGTGGVTLAIRPSSSGSEVRGLAVTGTGTGIALSGVTDVVLDQIWVHDTLERGVGFENTLGPTSVTLQRSLIENNHEIGVVVLGAEASLADVVVRGTLPRTSDQLRGLGISIEPHPASGAPATAQLSRVVIEDNHEVGVFIKGSHAAIEGAIVRGTLPRASDQLGGAGIAMQMHLANSTPATALMKSTLIERNHEGGVVVFGSQPTLEGVVVRGTQPRATNQEYGRGIDLEVDPINGAPANAILRATLVEGNHDFGVLVSGSQATLEGVLVRDTLSRASDQTSGVGIAIQAFPLIGTPANAIVKGSVVDNSYEEGVLVHGGHATLEGVLVRATSPRAADGLFGEGVAIAVALLQETTIATSAAIASTLIDQNARAGVGNFGAEVALGASAFACNTIDLNGETHLALPHIFENLGGNGCGCPEPTGACAAKSAGLTPPDALGDPY